MTENSESNTNESSNSININTNNLNKNKIYSYKNDLWMYFDSIKDKFFFDRTKAKSLLYIISQKNDLEYEYSQSLKYLYDQFTTQFDNYVNQNSKDNEYNQNTLNLAINNLIYNLKYESELYLNHSKYIIENILRPLESFIMNQSEINYELIGLMESYEKEFKLVNHLVEQKQVNFHHGIRAVESAMNKLELIKQKINGSNIEDSDINNNNNIFNLDEEDNEDEMIEKLTEIVEKNKISSKQLQTEYEDYIIKANNERIKYIKLSESLYDKVQKIDEEFINMMKNKINLMINKELNLIESIKNRKLKMLEYSNKINVENDIKNFINSKLVKFNRPNPFELVDYNPEMILRNKKSPKETIQHKISLNILENLKKIFKYEKIKKNEIEEENYNFINDTVHEIWDGNNYNKKKLELLFKEHNYRFYFLKTLNQYRVEGIFILKNISFQNFCMALSSLLDNSVKEEDYECIKLSMILSQTFYLDGQKKILLQSGITLNTIWQSKEFWDKMIEFSINDEINNTKGYLVFLEENSKTREKRVESSIISNLITFSFNMKLFGYPENESKIIIDEFIKKYKIDGSMIYASIVSMKDIKDDIIVESVDNIVNNKITEDNNNKNNLKRTDTNDSKNEDKTINIINNKDNNDNV